MKSARLTIIALMCVVGMVAISLALGRPCMPWTPGCLPAFSCLSSPPTWGFFRVVRNARRNLARFGSASSLRNARRKFIRLGKRQESVDASFKPRRRAHPAAKNSPGSDRLDLIYHLAGYLLLAVVPCEPPAFWSRVMGPGFREPVVLTTAALIAGLPQLFIALAGGLLARRFFPTRTCHLMTAKRRSLFWKTLIRGHTQMHYNYEEGQSKEPAEQG